MRRKDRIRAFIKLFVLAGLLFAAAAMAAMGAEGLRFDYSHNTSANTWAPTTLITYLAAAGLSFAATVVILVKLLGFPWDTSKGNRLFAKIGVTLLVNTMIMAGGAVACFFISRLGDYDVMTIGQHVRFLWPVPAASFVAVYLLYGGMTKRLWNW